MRRLRYQSFVLNVWLFLFAYISLIPFYYLQPVQLSFNPSTFTFLKYLPPFLIGLLALLCLADLRRPPYHLEGIPIDFYAGLYLLVCGLSLVGSNHLVVGTAKFLYYLLTGIFLAYVLVNQIEGKSSIRLIIRWIVVTTTLVAGYGILVYIAGRDFLWREFYIAYNPYYAGPDRLASSLGNAVFAGSYFSLCLPFALWSYFSERDRNWKGIFAVSSSVIILGLVLTFSRGGWIAGCVGILIFLAPRLRFVRSKIGENSPIRLAITGITLLLLLLSVLESVGLRKPMFRAYSTFLERIDQAAHFTSSQAFRLAQFKTTQNVLSDHPFLGVGFGNFTRLYEQYREPSIRSVSSATTDNMYLMVLCETGILGFTAFLALLFILLLRVYQAFSSTPLGSDRDLLLALFGAILGFVINMSSWDALNEPVVRMTFWILVGIAFKQMKICDYRA